VTDPAAGAEATPSAVTVGGVEEAIPASSDAARVQAVAAPQMSSNMQGNCVIEL
jgi:hypothetical protein